MFSADFLSHSYRTRTETKLAKSRVQGKCIAKNTYLQVLHRYRFRFCYTITKFSSHWIPPIPFRRSSSTTSNRNWTLIDHFPKRHHHPWEGQTLNSWPRPNVLTCCNKLEVIWVPQGNSLKSEKKEMKASLKEDHTYFQKSMRCDPLAIQFFLLLFDLQMYCGI